MKAVLTVYSGQMGNICLPLKSNVPEGREGWQLTTCNKCGVECWRNVELIDLAKKMNPDIKELCTICALKAGI